MKNFNVTFTEKTKYNPMTRTIMVQAENDIHAINLIHSEFGSFKFDKKLMMTVPSDKKIGIDKIEEVKETPEKKLRRRERGLN